jgi:hypothetical protein
MFYPKPIERKVLIGTSEIIIKAVSLNTSTSK